MGPGCLRRYQQDKRIGRRRLFLRPTDDRQPLLHDMVHLAKGHRLRNMTQDEILKEVIEQKLQTSVDTNISSNTDDVLMMKPEKEEEQKLVLSKIPENNLWTESL